MWTPPLKEIHYFDQRIKEPSFAASLVRLCFGRYTDENLYPWYWRNQSRRLLRSVFRSGKKPDPGTAAWAFRFLARPPSDEWYASLFEQGRGRVTGEATPEYAILEEGAVAHVRELMPNARTIFFMRNPIERLYSSPLMRLRHLEEMGRGTKADDEFFGGFFRETEVVAETKYLRNIELWRRFYPDEQIFVGFLEDIHPHPARLLQRLHSFLGVDPSLPPQAEKRKVNATSHETMPTRVAVHLAHAYHEDLRSLSARFGGYADFWLHCAEGLMLDPPKEEEIPYPLWESRLRKDREKRRSPDARDGEVQSRALAPS